MLCDVNLHVYHLCYILCAVANVALTLADILGGSETGDVGPCNGQGVQLSSSNTLHRHQSQLATSIPDDARRLLQLKDIYKETFLLCHAFTGGTGVRVDPQMVMEVDAVGEGTDPPQKKYLNFFIYR